MTSEQFQRLYSRLLSVRVEGPVPELSAMRSGMETSALPAAEDVSVTGASYGDLTGELLVAAGSRSDRIVFYIHGGGFVMGSPNTHRKLAGDLSRACDAGVVLLDYPLAPETAFPGQIESLVGSARLVMDDFGPEKVVFAGDSAGGGLVVSCMLALRDGSHDLPAAAVCLSPWADLQQRDRSQSPNVESDAIVRPQDTERMAGWYLQGADPANSLASPARADLSGLPPLLIQVGAAEILVDDSRQLAATAEANGVETTLEVWPDMVHVWQMFAGRVPESTEAVERIGQFVRASFSDFDQ